MTLSDQASTAAADGDPELIMQRASREDAGKDGKEAGPGSRSSGWTAASTPAA